MIVETDTYKATWAKIEAYGEKYGRFGGGGRVIVLMLRGARLLEMAGLYEFGWLY